MGSHIIIESNFYDKAEELRGFFDQQFANPREAHEMRFVWDKWFVEDQYAFTRTPSYHYFPEQMYLDFQSFLIQWGQENLGCSNISPPWLSYYTEGDFQNWHADVPHGPWAFVFSLSPNDITYRGGKTQILNPNTLNYWEYFDPSIGLEREDICTYIDSPFNQLTLFDPRFPHRVEPVHGTQDPTKGRLVIHGWFTEPNPFVKGYQNIDELTDPLNHQLGPLLDKLSSSQIGTGTCSYKMEVSTEGLVTSVNEVTNTVIVSDPDSQPEFESLKQALMSFKLPENTEKYQITLPLVFS
tara:strand:- start:94190 stop:95080 length:891 start_codon:yes stop_codon:yes gene_type:complete